MVPDPTKACVGMEYFCFAGDDLWSMSDDDLVAARCRRARAAGARADVAVERGYAIRVPKAYPIYDADYAERVRVIRAWLDGIDNLQQVGRNGLHRYNNSDHSMLTAMRAVDNLLARRRARHLGGQRRERLPRDAHRGRASVPLGARDARGRSARCLRHRLGGLLLPVAVAAAAAALVWLALPTVWWTPLNVDEELTLRVSDFSFAHIFHIVSTQRGGGPVHFWLAHFLLDWWPGLAALRVPSLVFSCLALPAVALIVKRLLGRRASGRGGRRPGCGLSDPGPCTRRSAARTPCSSRG